MIGLKAKLIAGAVVVALIGYLMWREHTLTHKLAETRVELNQSKAQLIAERQARQHEKEIADAASNQYQADLERIRNAPSIGPVRLCPRPRNNVSAASTAASGSDAGASGRVEGTVEADSEPIDVGPALDDYGGDCEAVSAQLRALQGWVRSR